MIPVYFLVQTEQSLPVLCSCKSAFAYLHYKTCYSGLEFAFPDCVLLWVRNLILFVILSVTFIALSSVQSLSRVWLFATPWTAARQASLSITDSWSWLKLMSIESVMPSNHLILCHLAHNMLSVSGWWGCFDARNAVFTCLVTPPSRDIDRLINPINIYVLSTKYMMDVGKVSSCFVLLCLTEKSRPLSCIVGFLFIYLFIYLFYLLLVVLGLRCRSGFPLVAASRGCSQVAEREFPLAVGSFSLQHAGFSLQCGVSPYSS